MKCFWIHPYPCVRSELVDPSTHPPTHPSIHPPTLPPTYMRRAQRDERGDEARPDVHPAVILCVAQVQAGDPPASAVRHLLRWLLL